MTTRRILIPHQVPDAAPPGGQVHEIRGETMGTTWSIKLVADARSSASLLRDGMQQVLDNIIQQMSHWQQDSELCCFNRAIPESWHTLSADFFEVLSYALSVAAQSEGAYDPAAGALVNAWGFGPAGRHDDPGFALPTEGVLQTIQHMPRWQDIKLDIATCRAYQPGGVILDFSAVAKGYAVDKLAHYLEQQGIRHYLIEVGGELRGAGMKPDGQPWWVMLENPPVDEGATLADGDLLLALHGLSVATSGDYRRYFVADQHVYPHTVDPRTGHPVHNGVASVTVVHADCMAADALSTALTVLGVKKGMYFAETHCLAVRFLVRRDGSFVEYTSSGFQDMLQ